MDRVRRGEEIGLLGAAGHQAPGITYFHRVRNFSGISASSARTSSAPSAGGARDARRDQGPPLRPDGGGAAAVQPNPATYAIATVLNAFSFSAVAGFSLVLCLGHID